MERQARKDRAHRHSHSRDPPGPEREWSIPRLSLFPPQDDSALCGQPADDQDKRHFIRAMSKASSVPVEPQEQTNLLEESIVCPGVIGGTVPGGEPVLLSRSRVVSSTLDSSPLGNACSRASQASPNSRGSLTHPAGGYDAIVLLIVDQAKVVTAVEKVWSEWKEMKVKPLKAGNSNGGLRRESVDGVEGLKEALERL